MSAPPWVASASAEISVARAVGPTASFKSS